jgi:hypothetical protein
MTRSVTGAAINATAGVFSTALNQNVAVLNRSLSKQFGGGIVGSALAAGLSTLTAQVGSSVIRQAANSLKDLALTGLPKTDAARLNSSIGSLNSGSVSVSLPRAASGTTDINNQAQKLDALVPTRVPKPNFNGNPATVGVDSATGESAGSLRFQRTQAWGAELRKKREQSAILWRFYNRGKADYEEALVSLPQGDPKIADLKKLVDFRLADYIAIQKEVEELEKNPPN